jgi:hypothetical protein
LLFDVRNNSTIKFTKINYYNPYARKEHHMPLFQVNNKPKPKMSNSFELLQGSIAEIQQTYVQPLFSMDFYKIKSLVPPS